jgi:hypothetical protein
MRLFRGFFVPIICLCIPATAKGADLRPLFDAIRQVESGGNPNAVGDGGRSIGPYQIQRAYWRDSGVPGRYESVQNPRYAERVMVGYWKRHAPRELARGDYEALARSHNGGPRGPHIAATRKYWAKVKRAMR